MTNSTEWLYLCWGGIKKLVTLCDTFHCSAVAYFVLCHCAGEFLLRLRQLEKSLLSALNEAKTRILDDDSIITHLETLKHEAEEIAKRVEETDATMAEVETTSQQYIPLAQSCSSIYFTLESLNQVLLAFTCINFCWRGTALFVLVWTLQTSHSLTQVLHSTVTDCSFFFMPRILNGLYSIYLKNHFHLFSKHDHSVWTC